LLEKFNVCQRVENTTTPGYTFFKVDFVPYAVGKT